MSPVRRSNPGNDAVHLAKAEEYLAAAALLLTNRHLDAAASAASVAGIKASDAICAATLAQCWTGDDHRGAIALLASAGESGVAGAHLLHQLLPVKNRAQYSIYQFTDRQAADAVRAATDLVGLARRVVAAAG
jgi:uncharacterized protein (UPF0332 family)